MCKKDGKQKSRFSITKEWVYLQTFHPQEKP